MLVMFVIVKMELGGFSLCLGRASTGRKLNLQLPKAALRFAALMNRYYLAALSAFCIWGFFALILKPMAIYPSPDILVYRVCFAGAFMLLAVLFTPGLLKRNLEILGRLEKKQQINIMVLTLAGGALLTANWYFFIFAMNHISIKSAAYAYLVCPIITTLLASIFLHEKLKGYQWLAFFLSVISCVLLALGHWVDLLYSLIVAFSYAFYLISQRRNIGLDRFFVLALQMVFSALILIPLVGVLKVSAYSEISFYFNIIVVALGFTILPLWLNLYALKGISSSVMGMLLYINPLLSFLVAAVVFHEPASPLQLISYAVIFLSVVIFNLGTLLKRSNETGFGKQ